MDINKLTMDVCTAFKNHGFCVSNTPQGIVIASPNTTCVRLIIDSNIKRNHKSYGEVIREVIVWDDRTNCAVAKDIIDSDLDTSSTVKKLYNKYKSNIRPYAIVGKVMNAQDRRSVYGYILKDINMQVSNVPVPKNEVLNMAENKKIAGAYVVNNNAIGKKTLGLPSMNIPCVGYY